MLKFFDRLIYGFSIVFVLFNVVNVLEAAYKQQAVLFIINVVSLWFSIYALVSLVTRFPVLPLLGLDKEHFYPETKKYYYTFLWPRLVRMFRVYYWYGKRSNPYANEVYDSDLALMPKLTKFQQRLLVGEIVYDHHIKTQGLAGEVIYRVKAIDQMDEEARRAFTHFEEGNRFEMLEVRHVQPEGDKTIVTVECKCCGMIHNLEDKVLATKLFKDHRDLLNSPLKYRIIKNI